MSDDADIYVSGGRTAEADRRHRVVARDSVGGLEEIAECGDKYNQQSDTE